jgi:hypothetical protein
VLNSLPSLALIEETGAKLHVAKSVLCNWYSNQLIGLKVIGLTVLLIILWSMLTQNWCSCTTHTTCKYLMLYIVLMLGQPYMKTSVERIGTVSLPPSLSLSLSCCFQLEHRSSVKRFVSGISLSQGRYLYKHKINADTHPCIEWDSNPRSQCSSERRQFIP